MLGGFELQAFSARVDAFDFSSRFAALRHGGRQRDREDLSDLPVDCDLDRLEVHVLQLHFHDLAVAQSQIERRI
jgi:hypothetical protein